MSDFSGKWLTTFGPMELAQDRASVRGVYHYGSTECSLKGKVRRGRLVFTYRESQEHGEGWFELTTSAPAGSRYRFQLADGMRCPDPASRAQAGDVHDASVVISPPTTTPISPNHRAVMVAR